MDKKTLIWGAVILGAAIVYWKFFHHKHKGMGTPVAAAKKKGGWRSRLKGVASSAARGALTQSGFGGVANIAGL
jgi:hypothetical protein